MSGAFGRFGCAVVVRELAMIRGGLGRSRQISRLLLAEKLPRRRDTPDIGHRNRSAGEGATVNTRRVAVLLSVTCLLHGPLWTMRFCGGFPCPAPDTESLAFIVEKPLAQLVSPWINPDCYAVPARGVRSTVTSLSSFGTLQHTYDKLPRISGNAPLCAWRIHRRKPDKSQRIPRRAWRHTRSRVT